MKNIEKLFLLAIFSIILQGNLFSDENFQYQGNDMFSKETSQSDRHGLFSEETSQSDRHGLFSEETSQSDRHGLFSEETSQSDRHGLFSEETSQSDRHGLFSKGSTSLGIKFGGASIGDEDYTIAGVSGNYFVMDNLSVGLGYERWFSGNPNISKITLESTYFLKATESLRPYAGLLYRRILIDGTNKRGIDFGDTNSYGYRLGVALVQDNIIISIGMVQEKYDTRQEFFDDTDTYAEVTIGFVF